MDSELRFTLASEREFQKLALSDSNDPDANLFNSYNFETSFLSANEAQKQLENCKQNFSILNINIRSISKNFDNFKILLQQLNFTFKVICISETWCKKDGEDVNDNENENKTEFSKFSLPEYKVVHQPRKKQNRANGGGVCIFVHDSLKFKKHRQLSVNDSDCEILSIEIINKKSRNIIISSIYRQPSGNVKKFKQHLKNHLTDNKLKCKTIYLAGDFNLNLLHHDTNKHVKNFVNTLLQHNLIPTINRPTRITKKTVTLIDNIITNDFSNISTGVIKSDVSDHFPNYLICEKEIDTSSTVTKIIKRSINKTTIKKFYKTLSASNWELVTNNDSPEHSYNVFIEIFSRAYNKVFPKKECILKPKTLKSPWMTESLLKSSKRKQKLYEKFLKKKTYANEKKYKAYTKLFERIKKQLKRNYYDEIMEKAEGNSKKTWNIIKEIIDKSKSITNNLPKQLNYKNEIISEKSKIAESFNDFFSCIGKNLASKIPNSKRNLMSYLKNADKIMKNNSLTPDELDKAFNTLQSNKSPGIDEISVNVVKEIYETIKPVLLHIFNLSITKGIFPSQLKTAKVTPIFKAGDPSDPGNYRPISVLPCFSKILERIMYNRLYEYLVQNNILYKKQFGFQKKHSTEHALMELISEITNSFENNECTIGVFIDLSKAFDTVDHDILISKLENYGVTGTNLSWFKHYLTDRKQCVTYDEFLTETKRITCGVPQGSILGPLLFLIYINDLHKTSRLLDFILFADDTNLFYSHKDIKTLFQIVNNELELISDWFIANKLSLNVKKTKYIFFCKNSKLDNLPLKLPALKVNNVDVKRVADTNFLGIIINETLNWNTHIKIIENKISKNIGVLYKAKQYLNINSLKKIYFAFINSYLNYCNIVWASTYKSKLKKIYNKQKHACRIIFGENKYTSISHRLKEICALNIYQLNIYQTLTFMHRVKNSNCPSLFLNQFKNVNHKYHTRYSENAFKIPKANLNAKRFAIRYRGPKLWNSVLSNEMKSHSLVKSEKGLKSLLKNFILNLRSAEKHF